MTVYRWYHWMTSSTNCWLPLSGLETWAELALAVSHAVRHHWGWHQPMKCDKEPLMVLLGKNWQWAKYESLCAWAACMGLSMSKHIQRQGYNSFNCMTALKARPCSIYIHACEPNNNGRSYSTLALSSLPNTISWVMSDRKTGAQCFGSCSVWKALSSESSMAGCFSGQETAAWVSFTTTPVWPAKRMSSSEVNSSIKDETCVWCVHMEFIVDT